MSNEFKEKLEKRLKEENIKCPYCSSNDIGTNNWNRVEGERDWFYYCKDCGAVFIYE